MGRPDFVNKLFPVHNTKTPSSFSWHMYSENVSIVPHCPCTVLRALSAICSWFTFLKGEIDEMKPTGLRNVIAHSLRTWKPCNALIVQRDGISICSSLQEAFGIVGGILDGQVMFSKSETQKEYMSEWVPGVHFFARKQNKGFFLIFLMFFLT